VQSCQLLAVRCPEKDDIHTVLQVAAQAFTFIMGGYETTASALAFAVHFIAQHPRVEAKLLAEIDAFGRTATPIYDDCDQAGSAARVFVMNQSGWLNAYLKLQQML
jgi:cytochrome P450